MMYKINYRNILLSLFLLLTAGKVIAQDENSLFAKAVVYFSTGSSTIDLKEKNKLDSLFNLSSKFKLSKVIVRSHTDSVGNLNDNIRLSEKRSNEVKKYLSQKGINGKLFDIENFGSSKPIADNGTETGRQSNRCTEIAFYRLQNQVTLSGILKDSETQKPIADSMVLVFNKETADTFFTDKNGQFEATLRVTELKPTFDIFVKDYFFESVDVDQTKANNVKINMPLKKAKTGNKALFDNINFNPGSAIMLSDSYKILDKIVRFLKFNPSKEIEIGGHVNLPNRPPVSENSEDFKLSVARANRVKMYFSEKGIKELRMTSKGYGSSFMIYPSARSEEEAVKNRRVEIVITKG